MAKMIHTLEFSIDIEADKAKIWDALWEDSSYRTWASVFDDGSHFIVNNWKVGNEVLFLGPDKNVIYSKIEAHTPNKIIRFSHIGTVAAGKKQPINKEVQKWSGATEIYEITEQVNLNTLTIKIDILEEHLDFMKIKLPIALEKVKTLSMNQ